MNKILMVVVLFFALLLPSQAQAKIAGITVTPDPLDFGDVSYGSSTSQTVTITSSLPLTVTVNYASLEDTTNFSIVNDGCAGRVMSSGDNCNVEIGFAPQVIKHIVTHLKLTINGWHQPGNASVIEGNGVGPDIAFRPLSIDFGDQTVGKASNERIILVDNFGNQAIIFTSITTNSPFSITYNDCGSSLAPQLLCNIGVTFTPTADGAASDDVTFVDNTTTSPQTISLTGTGVSVPQPHASLSRAQIDFGNVLVGATSSVEEVTLKNTGTLVLNIADVSINGDFSVSDDCGNTLAVNALCTLSIDFSPTSEGALTGTVTITDDSSHSPQTITLSGRGIIHDEAKASLSSASIDFGEQEDYTTSDPQDYTIANVGSEDMIVSDIEVSGDDAANFAKSSDCQRTLGPGDSCTGSITFTPDEQRSFSAQVSFTDNTTDSPQVITLTGSGVGYILEGGGGCTLIPRK